MKEMNTKKWVKRLIKAKKKIVENRKNGCMELCGEFEKEIQVHKGILKMANDLGLELKKKSFPIPENPEEAFFEYCGIIFFQLLSKEEVEKNEIK